VTKTNTQERPSFQPEALAPSYDAVDYLVGAQQSAAANGKDGLAESLAGYLDSHLELIKGDTWGSKRLAEFLKGAEPYEANSELEFMAPWFSLEAGTPGLSERLRDAEEVLTVLGFAAETSENRPDVQVTGYSSGFFPRMNVARMETADGKRVAYVVGTRPG
jgi:hypothetical protein